MSKSYKIGYLLVLLGGFFWGAVGILGYPVLESGLPTLNIVSIKTAIAAFSLVIIVYLWRPYLLKIRIKDVPFFIMTGFLIQFVFGYGYYNAIRIIGPTLAVILLYTAPVFVTVYSAMFFGEKFTTGKAIGLVATLSGCVLAVGGFGADYTTEVSILGIVYGILAGVTYASYTIMGKISLDNYSPVTVTTYSLFFGALILLIFYPPLEEVIIELDYYRWLSLIGMGLVSTLLAFVCYTAGLERIESSKASILSTFEVVTAAVLAYIFLGEALTFHRIFGILLVLLGIFITREN